ncbi:ACT domain-containing protein [Virgibacillus sp. MSJ-26]|uniref:ACT domain-containing protein n=1 Tax=Virgibacillus sp. MSJ-26 TaxID=2841522 RepID=UPI001C114566|nr:ACT domain-containing protein [Virgibacillus sp. MSJ-26]MBU5466515.1 ACT domain-containing protein [Virgibacillus sp. MSJ-26]
MIEGKEKFYLVKSSVLPEAMLKTIKAKKLLEEGKTKTIHQAVRQVGLSRSAFYKYKNAVFPFQSLVKDEIVTLFIHLDDHLGTLSHLLGIVSKHGCNVLTVHQTIPIQGTANVTLSLEMTHLNTTIEMMLKELGEIEFVKRVELLSSEA